MVDDDDETIVAGCFECVERDGDIIDVLNGNPVNISLGRIADETVLGYAHFMLTGIIEQIKLEKKKEQLEKRLVMTEKKLPHLEEAIDQMEAFVNTEKVNRRKMWASEILESMRRVYWDLEKL